ncbi:hypothetical protein UFOVP81_34 [uncultured Caudovirales phage]|uniref:Uncharacterized protein n=1 Tax=uncultured Caudovirales phage TaxID=2100421 RepID=A0A6J5L017_9CAUD|nr:hypothetical protein UFOVP81_34 [uncultured Caudovirales phage]
MGLNLSRILRSSLVGLEDTAVPTAQLIERSMSEIDAGLARAAKAKSLPTPVELTAGQATQNPKLLEFEKREIYGAHGEPLIKRSEDQASALDESFSQLIDDTGRSVEGAPAVGERIHNALFSGYEKDKQQVRDLYQLALNSQEAQQVVSSGTRVNLGESATISTDALVQFIEKNRDGPRSELATQALEYAKNNGLINPDGTPLRVPNNISNETTLVDWINKNSTGTNPYSAMVDLAKTHAERLGIATIGEHGELIPANTTVERMEELIKTINSAQPSDAVGVYQRTMLNQIINKTTEDVSGPLFRVARNARRVMAEKYEDRSIVASIMKTKKGSDDRQIALEKIVNHIISKSDEEVAFIRNLLQQSQEGTQAWKDLQGSVLEHIRKRATDTVRTTSEGIPLFSAYKLGVVLKELERSNKLNIIFGESRANIIRNINEVVSYINNVPPGTLINNSGTAMTLVNLLTDMGFGYSTIGMPLPVYNVLQAVRRFASDRDVKRRISTVLKDIDEGTLKKLLKDTPEKRIKKDLKAGMREAEMSQQEAARVLAQVRDFTEPKTPSAQTPVRQLVDQPIPYKPISSKIQQAEQTPRIQEGTQTATVQNEIPPRTVPTNEGWANESAMDALVRREREQQASAISQPPIPITNAENFEQVLEETKHSIGHTPFFNEDGLKEFLSGHRNVGFDKTIKRPYFIDEHYGIKVYYGGSTRDVFYISPNTNQRKRYTMEHKLGAVSIRNL